MRVVPCLTLAIALALAAAARAEPPAPAPPVPAPEGGERVPATLVRRSVPGEQPLNRVMPFYSKPRQSRCNAWVRVGFTITLEGRVDAPAVVEQCPAKPPDADAVKAVAQWRFSPRKEPTRSRALFRFQTDAPCDCPEPKP